MPIETSLAIDETQQTTDAAVLPVEEGQAAPEGGAPTDPAPQDPPPFRAWEAKREPPPSIPYSRFVEVNTEATTYRQKAEQLERQIQELQARDAKLPASPDDVKPEDFPNDPQGYLKALTAAVARKTREDAIQEVRQEFQAREIQAQAVREQQTFEASIQEAAKENPDVVAARRFFDEHADKIHPAVARELILDKNVGHLMVRLATDQGLLEKLFQGHPVDAIRMIHGEAALIAHARKQGVQAPAAVTPPAVTPPALQPTRPTPSVPLKPKGTPSAGTTLTPAQIRALTPAQYQEYKKRLG